MRAVYRSSFAGAAWDSCAAGPAACVDDAGESAALAVTLLELLDVRARVRSGGRDPVHGGGGVWGAALRSDSGGQCAALAVADGQRNLAQGECAESDDAAIAG